MELERSLVSGSMGMLVMKLLEERDLYGYQMIEELKHRSDDTFHLKAGSLYPLLHGLEEKGYV
ncbi:MAG: helix-turn-helix transcriptional regulator, partial [Oscillospiraceae bacterium]|nr:helix-turn-helix transcriptional regulator [Oscillospiraceae bacterium]